MFEDRLKRLRIARGLSQQKVADDLNLKVNTYRNYENNEREPSANTLIRIGNYYGVTLDYLLDYHSDNSNIKLNDDKWSNIKGKIYNLSDEAMLDLEKVIDYLQWRDKNQTVTIKRVARGGSGEVETIEVPQLVIQKLRDVEEDDSDL